MERSKTVKGIQWATLVVVLLLWVYPASVYIGWKKEVNAVQYFAGHGEVKSTWEVPEKYDGLLEKFSFVDDHYFRRCKTLRISSVGDEDAAAAALDAFKHLDALDLDGVALTSKLMSRVAELDGLGVLVIRNTTFPGEYLKYVGRLKNLDTLMIADADGVRDVDLAHLSALSRLEWLRMDNSSVSGTGFASLRHISTLEVLSLSEAPLNDAGLREIAALPSVEFLLLGDAKFVGPGLRELKSLETLRWLDVAGTSISNDDLEYLSEFPKLKYLDLRRTDVSDEGLEHLAKIPTLSSLNLKETRVSGLGLGFFKQSIYVDLREAPVSEDDLKTVVEEFLPGGGRLIVSPGVLTGDWWRSVGADYSPREIFISVEE